MSINDFTEMIQAFIYCYGPVLIWWGIFLTAGAIISAMGLVLLEIASRMTH